MSTSRKTSRRGATLILMGLLMSVLVAMGAFALDLGYIAVVNAELQNAADAAALAGASKLLDRTMLQRSNPGQPQLSTIGAEVQLFAGLNKAGGAAVTPLANPQNTATGDIVVGHLTMPCSPSSEIVAGATPYNAVKVLARRGGAGRNDPLPLFFGTVIGSPTAEVAADATAVLEGNVKGFAVTGTNPQVVTSKLLPFAMDEVLWTSMMNDVGNDDWGYNPTTKQVTAGQDGIKEANLYGSSKLTPGNFGTIDIGNPNNSTADLERQIRYGINQDDFSYLGGQLALDSGGSTQLTGDTGMSVGFQDAMAAVIGQPRIMPIYRTVTDNGNNATFTIVGFAGIVITEVALTGGNKHVTVQPEFVIDPTAIGGGDTGGNSDFVYVPVRLAR